MAHIGINTRKGKAQNMTKYDAKYHAEKQSRGADQWNASVQFVTPEDAAMMLESSNFNNRKLRPATVKKYAATIASGNWKLTPEPIIFTVSGRLANGQHRLTAVVNSGIPTHFMIVRNVSDDVYEALDRGAVRTHADALQISKKLSEVARLAAITLAKGPAVTVPDSQVKKWADILEQANADLLAHCGSARRVFSSAPIRLAAILRSMIDKDGGEYAFRTYHDLVMGQIGDLSAYAQAFYAAGAQGRFHGGGSNRQAVMLATALRIFNRSNSERRIVRVPTIDRATADVRNALCQVCDFTDD